MTGPMTSAQYPAPANASASVPQAATSASAPSAQASRRKSSSRLSSARGTICSAPTRKLRLETMMIHRTAGSAKNAASGVASSADSATNPPPMTSAKPPSRAI